VLDRAREAGIVRILVPGWNLASSRAAVELAERHPDLIVAAVGIHPHDAAAASSADWEELEALAGGPAVAAVGEIGLDFHRNLSPPDRQREAFARQLALAAAVGKPVIVHDREAHREVTELLLAWAAGAPTQPATAAPAASHAPRGVLHAFSGDRAMAERLVDAGFVISFALPVAFRSATGPREAAAALPTGFFLVETDSPYLGPASDRRNEPTTSLRVAAQLARLRGEAPESIAAAAGETLRRLLREPPATLAGTRLADSASGPPSGHQE
jgi:TatD DNase family protein